MLARSPRTPVAKPVAKPEVAHAEPAAPHAGDELLRVAEVARALKVSRKRVYQLVEEGDLLSLRLGPRLMRIPRRSLERLVQTKIREEASREP